MIFDSGTGKVLVTKQQIIIDIKKILIENYYKFLKTHTKYYKSPTLNLNRYGFSLLTEDYLWDLDCKPKKHIRNVIKAWKITEGHIVSRVTTHGYGERYIEIWYNEKILDKYGKLTHRKHHE